MKKALLALAASLPVTLLAAQDPAVGGAVHAVGGAVHRPDSSPPSPPPAVDAASASAPLPSPAPQAPMRARTRIEFALGGGSFDHETDGSALLNDDTSGGYARLAFEHIGDEGSGGGIRLEGSASEGDLFGTDVEASEGELFLYFTSVLGDDDARFPVRIGLSLRSYTLDDPAGIDPTWNSIGPRFEIEPDLRLDRGDSTTRWSLYGRLGVFLGFTEIETDPSTDHWHTTSYGLDVGAGTRFAFSHVELGLGYLLRFHHADESDTSGGVAIREYDAYFSGVEVALAVVF
jgi:hypothetical protein